MSKKRSTEFSVADLKAQVRHKVNVQRLFDQFAAINVDKCLEVNTRTLESWLVAKFGLQVTKKCDIFEVYNILALFLTQASSGKV